MEALGSQLPLIEAAGGLVWAGFPDGSRLAIVHRTRYGNEWTLPKGKRDPSDAGLEDTAVREVCEETKLSRDDLEVREFVKGIAYITEKGPKAVFFWDMRYAGALRPLSMKITDSGGEVDGIRWVTAAEAISLLRYPGEREIVRETAAIRSGKTPRSLMAKILGLIRRFYNYRSYRRLVSESAPFEIEINKKISVYMDPSHPEQSGQHDQKIQMSDAALEHLERIHRALEAGDIELGWRHLHAAQQIALILDDDPESLKNNASATLDECTEKLTSWRKTAVNHLLAGSSAGNDSGKKEPDGKSPTVKDPVTVRDLAIALKILYEDKDNLYDKIQRFQYQFIILGIIGFLALGVLILSLPGTGDQIRMDNNAFLFSIIASGALGGTVSSIYTISRESDPKKKIPDQILNSWTTLMRPLVGAMSALAVLLFLMSGILNLNMGNVSVSLVLAIAFVSGFSERLIIVSTANVLKEK
jgi:8-oxo-dGTP pyrophosphatase MutT (NUDIX family)